MWIGMGAEPTGLAFRRPVVQIELGTMGLEACGRGARGAANAVVALVRVRADLVPGPAPAALRRGVDERVPSVLCGGGGRRPAQSARALPAPPPPPRAGERVAGRRRGCLCRTTGPAP